MEHTKIKSGNEFEWTSSDHNVSWRNDFTNEGIAGMTARAIAPCEANPNGFLELNIEEMHVPKNGRSSSRSTIVTLHGVHARALFEYLKGVYEPKVTA